GFVGLGAALTLAGMVVLGPSVARPVAAVLGAPLAKLRGVTGGLARLNAGRNPRRTAGAAAALLVGVSVVTLITVFAASFESSLNTSMSEAFAGDLVVNSGGFGGQSGFGPGLATTLQQLPQVRSAAGIGLGDVVLDGAHLQATIANPGDVAGTFDLK